MVKRVMGALFVGEIETIDECRPVFIFDTPYGLLSRGGVKEKCRKQGRKQYDKSGLSHLLFVAVCKDTKKLIVHSLKFIVFCAKCC